MAQAYFFWSTYIVKYDEVFACCQLFLVPLLYQGSISKYLGRPYSAQRITTLHTLCTNPCCVPAEGLAGPSPHRLLLMTVLRYTIRLRTSPDHENEFFQTLVHVGSYRDQGKRPTTSLPAHSLGQHQKVLLCSFYFPIVMSCIPLVSQLGSVSWKSLSYTSFTSMFSNFSLFKRWRWLITVGIVSTVSYSKYFKSRI